jgi:hypothetical protein
MINTHRVPSVIKSILWQVPSTAKLTAALRLAATLTTFGGLPHDLFHRLHHHPTNMVRRRLHAGDYTGKNRP